MSRRSTHVALLALGLMVLGACKAEDPNTISQQEPQKPDAGVATALEAPRLGSGLPDKTPLASVALRGKTKGSRIIVKGGADGVVTTLPLPSGDFCIDVPLSAGATTTLTVLALDGGLVSSKTTYTVTNDSSAIAPSSPYCDPPACKGKCPTKEYACADNTDNDQDGWTDSCDPDCNACTDDALEPNDYPMNVPLVTRDKTYDLTLCPCHDDWFAVYLHPGDKLQATVTGNDPTFNVDMKLFRAKDAEAGGYKSNNPLVTAASPSSNDMVNWTADKKGMYYVYVYAADANQSGGYRLWTHVEQQPAP